MERTPVIGSASDLTSRRTVLKAGVALLPYVAPAMLSFRATWAAQKQVSPKPPGPDDKPHPSAAYKPASPRPVPYPRVVLKSGYGVDPGG